MFLANDDLGDSLDNVEALIKKQEDFEKSLAAQEEKINALDEFATKLIESEHYAADSIAVRRNGVSIRLMYLVDLSNYNCIDDLYSLHLFYLMFTLFISHLYRPFPHVCGPVFTNIFQCCLFSVMSAVS